VLKRLTILGLLLAAMSPIPGQTANNPAGGSGSVQKQPENGNAKGQSPASAIPQNSAGPAKPDAEQPSAENAGNPVTVGKLPTVSIGKDWADWSYWGFGGILVVVGSLQVWFLFRTLGAIQVQAGHMERQTKILEDSVAAAQKGADAAIAQVEMVKAKERAQLRIEFARPHLAFDEKLGGYPIHFRVTLDGTTRARIRDDSIIAYSSQRPREKGGWRVMGIPDNFTPEMSPYPGNTLLHTDEPFSMPERDNLKIAMVCENKATVFVNGRIWYTDIFGDEWMLEIDRYWDAMVESWGPVGSGRYDGHRKVDTSRRDQYLAEKAN
jgi:hypothetical protein